MLFCLCLLVFFNGLFLGELCMETWRVDAFERRFKYTMFGSRVVRQLTYEKKEGNTLQLVRAKRPHSLSHSSRDLLNDCKRYPLTKYSKIIFVQSTK